MSVLSCCPGHPPVQAASVSLTEPTRPPPVIGAGFCERSYRRHSALRLGRGEARMAALGIEPAAIDEETAAAICGLPVKRFRAECPIPGQRVGNKVLRPLDLVKQWSVRYWAEATGFPLEGIGRDAEAAESDDWASALPDAPEAKGGRHGNAH